MKPGKNRIFCPACRRQKMVFSTKEEADRFIVFNRKEILSENRKAPVRSYYCPMCCAYHVTSNPSLEAGSEMDEVDKERLERILSLKKAKTKNQVEEKPVINPADRPQAAQISNRLYNSINERVLTKMMTLKLDEAVAALDSLQHEAEEEAKGNTVWASKLPAFIERVHQLLWVINHFREIHQDAQIADEPVPEHFRKSVRKAFSLMVQNEAALLEFRRIMTELEAGIGKIDKDVAIDILCGARHKVNALHGNGIASVQQALNKWILEILPKYEIIPSEIGLSDKQKTQSEESSEQRKKKNREKIIRVISLLEVASSTDNEVIRNNSIASALDMLKKIPDCDEKNEILIALGYLPDEVEDFASEDDDNESITDNY